VHDASYRSGILLFQNPQGILRCLPGMDHQGFAAGFGGPDVAAKALPLPFRSILMPVIVQTGFPDGYHPGMIRQPYQGGLIRVRSLRDLRVYAHRGQQIGVAFGQGQNPGKIFQVDGNTEGGAYLVLAHSLQDLGGTFLKFGEIQVAVGVDQHGKQ